MSKAQYLVYKATGPTGRNYIGITAKSLEKRRSEHIYDAKRGSARRFHRALAKHAPNFTWSILAFGLTLELANLLEMAAVAAHGAFWKDGGYNLTLGGDGVPGFVWTERSRKNQSKNAKQSWQNPEFVAAQMAYKRSKKSRENLSNAQKSYWANPDNRKKRRKLVWTSGMAQQLSCKLRQAWANNPGRGFCAPNKKLSVAQAMNVRILLALGASQADCGVWFGLKQPAISAIKLSRTKTYTWEAEALANGS